MLWALNQEGGALAMESDAKISKAVVAVGVVAALVLVVMLVLLGLHYREQKTVDRLRMMSDAQLTRYISDGIARAGSRRVLKLAVEEKKAREARLVAAEQAADSTSGDWLSRVDKADEMAQSAGMVIGIGIGVFLAVVFYFLPTYIARRREHHNLLAIFLANCFFGWTGGVWLALIVWACSDLQQHRAIMEMYVMMHDQDGYR